MTEMGRFGIRFPVELSQDGIVWVSDEQNATVKGEIASSTLVTDIYESVG